MKARFKRMEIRALRATRDRAAKLIARYPKLSRHEVREVVQFVRTGRHVDLGVLAANEQIRPKFDAFMADHKRQFRLTFEEVAGVLVLFLAFFLVCWMMWEMLGPRPL
jgi:hypothetical protein